MQTFTTSSHKHNWFYFENMIQTEKEKMILFTASEKKEYKKIEKEAQDWYIRFRSANRISKHFLKISSKLTPLRIACSGGNYPIDSQKLEEDELEQDKITNRSTKLITYSNFAFQSKFKTLLARLEKIRDTEPDGKFHSSILEVCRRTSCKYSNLF